MRVGDRCVFVKYRRSIRPGARVFEPGDMLVAVEKEGDCSYICHVITREGQIVPWLRDTIYLDEYVRLRNGPAIIELPAPVLR